MQGERKLRGSIKADAVVSDAEYKKTGQF